MLIVPPSQEFIKRRLSSVQRRYTRAWETLARVRKINPLYSADKNCHGWWKAGECGRRGFNKMVSANYWTRWGGAGLYLRNSIQEVCSVQTSSGEPPAPFQRTLSMFLNVCSNIAFLAVVLGCNKLSNKIIADAACIKIEKVSHAQHSHLVLPNGISSFS